MREVAQIVKRRLFESDNMSYDDSFIRFIHNLQKVSPEEIRATEQDILKAVSRLRLNENATDDARDYILSGKYDSEVKFERVLDTLDDLFENPGKNFREIMMNWYAYCSGEIGELYRFREWQMMTGVTVDDVPFIDFLIPETVVDSLVTVLRSLGLVQRNEQQSIVDYVCTKYRELTEETQSLQDKFNGWIYLRFAPMSQKNVRDTIRQNSKYIYHITDASNIDSIKKNGFILDNRSHPEVQPRLFLVVPDRSDIVNREDVRQRYSRDLFDFNTYLHRALPLRIHQYRVEDGSVTEMNPYKWKFAVVEIDIDKVPEDIEFYWDIHSFPFAFFTRDSIPASAVSDYKIETIL